MSGRPPVITLLTDFGLEDVYAGVVKGVGTRVVARARGGVEREDSGGANSGTNSGTNGGTDDGGNGE